MSAGVLPQLAAAPRAAMLVHAAALPAPRLATEQSLSLSLAAPRHTLQPGLIQPASSTYVSSSMSTGGRTRRVVAQAASAELDLQSRPSEGASSPQGEDDDKWQVKILYDGDCPLCMKEVDFLQKRNEAYNTIKFVDISADNYSPEENAGVTFEQAMGHIHGIMRDGTVVTGIEAFRKFYDAIGLGWVYAITKFKAVEVVADAVYEVWAKYRLPLTGRPNLEAFIEQRRLAKKGVQGCGDNPEEECVVEY